MCVYARGTNGRIIVLPMRVCNGPRMLPSNKADFPERVLSLARYVVWEVRLTVSKKGSFGGYGIELDTPLATVLGGREGQKISPSEMTKRLWQYVKRHNLGKKE